MLFVSVKRLELLAVVLVLNNSFDVVTAWTLPTHPATSIRNPLHPLNARSSLPLTVRTALPKPPDVERPSPDVLVSSLSLEKQKLVFALITAALFAGTVEFVHLLDSLQSLNAGIFDLWALSWPLGLGGIFTAAGITHFTNKDDYVSIMPPKGTWGFFTVPYPENPVLDYATFHVFWTGIAEIAGGSNLAVSSFGAEAIPREVASACLLLLTVAVTPANIYMATHDAQMGSLPPVPYPAGHVFRGALQCVVLGFLWKLTFH